MFLASTWAYIFHLVMTLFSKKVRQINRAYGPCMAVLVENFFHKVYIISVDSQCSFYKSLV